MSKVKKESNEKNTSEQQPNYNIPSFYFCEDSDYNFPNSRSCDGECGGCPNFYDCNK